jgi:hypothetical protein
MKKYQKPDIGLWLDHRIGWAEGGEHIRIFSECRSYSSRDDLWAPAALAREMALENAEPKWLVVVCLETGARVLYDRTADWQQSLTSDCWRGCNRKWERKKIVERSDEHCRGNKQRFSILGGVLRRDMTFVPPTLITYQRHSGKRDNKADRGDPLHRHMSSLF